MCAYCDSQWEYTEHSGKLVNLFVCNKAIGAGDAMAAMAIAMAGIWRVHETATPGHHNRWHTLTFYYIKRDMKQEQIEVKMYICIK